MKFLSSHFLDNKIFLLCEKDGEKCVITHEFSEPIKRASMQTQFYDSININNLDNMNVTTFAGMNLLENTQKNIGALKIFTHEGRDFILIGDEIVHVQPHDADFSKPDLTNYAKNIVQPRQSGKLMEEMLANPTDLDTAYENVEKKETSKILDEISNLGKEQPPPV